MAVLQGLLLTGLWFVTVANPIPINTKRINKLTNISAMEIDDIKREISARMTNIDANLLNRKLQNKTEYLKGGLFELESLKDWIAEREQKDSTELSNWNKPHVSKCESIEGKPSVCCTKCGKILKPIYMCTNCVDTEMQKKYKQIDC